MLIHRHKMDYRHLDIHSCYLRWDKKNAQFLIQSFLPYTKSACYLNFYYLKSLKWRIHIIYKVSCC